MERLRAFLSYVLSFRHREGSWRFEDYPVRVTRQSPDDCLRPTTTRTDYPPFRAQFINWWTIAGLGNTPKAATDDLRQNFECFRRNQSTIPRPGCYVFVQFADSSIVQSDPEIYRKFIVDVLGFGPDNLVFISDESSLFDFAGVDGDIDLFERTRDVFGVDVSDVTDGNLASIFSRIQEAT